MLSSPYKTGAFFIPIPRSYTSLLLDGAPLPRSYTSLLLDGVARNFFFLFLCMVMQDHTIYHVWIHLFIVPPMLEKRKTIWSELESNPGPLTSQATALTSRPCLHGQKDGS